MKRFLLLLLCLALLTGCGDHNNTASTEAPEATQQARPPELTPREPTPPPVQPEPTPPAAQPEPAPEPDPRTEAVETLLAEMTLAEKVGQLFFVRCPAANEVDLIGQYHLGGYLLFGRDFKDSGDTWLTMERFTEKIAAYQSAGKIPLLIGVDEEGGTVARATRNPNLFPKKRRSPQTVFQNGGMEAIAADTLAVNSSLLTYGINVNFAPVADVATDPTAFIYDRTFGQNAEATAQYIETAVTAMSESGIGSVLKHFPGYGNNADTHTGIAVDDRPYEEFIHSDFLPFRAGIEAGAGAVLVSHNIVECMDETLPASLSPEVHRVLRQELGFTGVALTDDLAMEAVEAYAAEGSVAVLALQAGNDMVVTTDFQIQIPAVIAAVEAGEISTETIDTAVRRVLGWKYDLGLFKQTQGE